MDDFLAGVIFRGIKFSRGTSAKFAKIRSLENSMPCSMLYSAGVDVVDGTLFSLPQRWIY